MVKLKTCVPKPTRNSSCCVKWKRLALAPRNLSQFTRVTWDLYAAPLWHPGLTQKQVDQVENIQKRVCRHILGWAYTSYPDSLAVLELESLEDRRLHICREFAVKCSTSGKFSRWFPPSEYRSGMTLREPRNFEFLKHKTNRFRDSPIPFMINLLTVVACTSGNLVIQVQHGFSLKKKPRIMQHRTHKTNHQVLASSLISFSWKKNIEIFAPKPSLNVLSIRGYQK